MTSPGQEPSTAPPTAEPQSPAPDQASVELEGPPSSGTERLVFVGCCLVGGVLAAIPAAWIWTRLADPPSSRLTDGGLTFGELAFNQVSAITFWFILVGFGFGLVLGVVAALLARRHGLVGVLAILLMAWVGSSLMLWLGIHVFGPDHPVDFVALFNASQPERTKILSEYQNGDLLVSSLTLTSAVALLAWPVGSMLGTLVGAATWPKLQKSAWMPPQ